MVFHINKQNDITGKYQKNVLKKIQNLVDRQVSSKNVIVLLAEHNLCQYFLKITRTNIKAMVLLAH